MDKTIVVTVVNLTLKQHVITAFCESLDKARASVSEFEAAYPGEGYRLMVSPPIAELEAREKNEIFREAFLQSAIMRPHNNSTR
ncbi:hypothetical protein [Pseudomonas serbica]|jgi:hypothetical protein|uniref:hypothetical protein n=1 Tax=Pseudomonas serbica TaxID=2965074 RepID=UPI00237BF4BB|nr:hypothetical protein [Pseudomonas serbica]